MVRIIVMINIKINMMIKLTIMMLRSLPIQSLLLLTGLRSSLTFATRFPFITIVIIIINIIINIINIVIIIIIIMVIIFNQVHYMYFALGAYGWPMYLLQNKSVTVSFLLTIITLT